MSQPIRIEREGQRVYFAGDTYAAKGRIKSMGGHWDPDTRRWWVGAAKAAAAEKLVADLASGPPPAEDLDQARVKARVNYKGRPYYAIAESASGDRLRLTTLDKMDPFWADASACETVRTYSPRTVGRGRFARQEYTTIGSLRRFRDSQERAKAEGLPACAACGRRGHLVEDMEDGMLKCHSCCDMPAH